LEFFQRDVILKRNIIDVSTMVPVSMPTYLTASNIGVTVQAYDAGLESIAGLTTAADRGIYATASDTYAVFPLTAAGRALIDDADAAAQRTTLGLTSAATGDADGLTSGALADARLSANVPLLASNNVWIDYQFFNGVPNGAFIFRPTTPTADAAYTAFRFDNNNVAKWNISVRDGANNFEFWLYNQTTSTIPIKVNNTNDNVALAGGLAIGGGTTVAKVLSESASLYFGSIAAGAEATLTITVIGALTANTPTVSLGWSAALEAGIIVKQAWVSATNYVSITVINVTVTAIDPDDVTCRATVHQF